MRVFKSSETHIHILHCEMGKHSISGGSNSSGKSTSASGLDDDLTVGDHDPFTLEAAIDSVR